MSIGMILKEYWEKHKKRRFFFKSVRKQLLRGLKTDHVLVGVCYGLERDDINVQFQIEHTVWKVSYIDAAAMCLELSKDFLKRVQDYEETGRIKIYGPDGEQEIIKCNIIVEDKE